MKVEREKANDNAEKLVAIVGTGFSGLAMAIRLKKKGIEDFVILEKADDIGGTWRDNSYPDAACDVPSHLYSFSFEPNSRWSRQFSGQAEIFAYLRHCADKYRLRPHIRFHSLVESAIYDEDKALWTLSIKGAPPIKARYFVSCTGGLSRPSYPKIQGLESFRGALFHSACWDHDFDLRGKRVGVIGTGASSIQLVPAIAAQVKELQLFQRTAAWILPKPNRSFRSWEIALFAGLPGFRYLLRCLLYWIFELRVIALLRPGLMYLGEKRARDYLDKKISDPELKRKLTPSYKMGCKRVLLSNNFYDSFRLSHVKLVDDGIAAVTPRGILTRDGREYELDAIVCATGFQVAEASAPFEILGRRGVKLSELWSEGAEAYLGTAVAGFPNMFTVVGPNTGLGHNSMVYMIEAQTRYILSAIKSAERLGLLSLEVKASAQKRYNQILEQRFKKTVWTLGGCKSWYQAPNGRNTTIWPGFTFEFALRTRKFDISAYEGSQRKPQSEADSLDPLRGAV